MRKQLFFGEARFTYPRNFRDVWIPGAPSLPIPISVLYGEKDKGVAQQNILLFVHGEPKIDPISDEVIGWGLTGWGTTLNYLRVDFTVPKGEAAFLDMTVLPRYLQVTHLPKVAILEQSRQQEQAICFTCQMPNGRVCGIFVQPHLVKGQRDRVHRFEGRTTFQHHLIGSPPSSLDVTIWDIGLGKPKHVMMLSVPVPSPVPPKSPQILQRTQPAQPTEEDHAYLVTVLQQYVNLPSKLQLWTLPYNEAVQRAQKLLQTIDINPERFFTAYDIPTL